MSGTLAEAFHYIEVILCFPHNFSDIDFLRRKRQFDAAAASADRMDEAHFPKLMDHFCQMVS